MSHRYVAVSWNPFKKRVDLAMAASIAAYLALFVSFSFVVHPAITIETALIRGFATAAFLMLTVVLSIGPLARLSPRFLPLLYNRRHLGVTTFFLGLAHATLVTIQFHAFQDVNPLVSVLGTDPGFQTLGVAALAILFLMAATSHDFWLANLGAPVWKALHFGVYAAYVLLLLHVGLGTFRAEGSPAVGAAAGLGALWIAGLHLVAGTRERKGDREAERRDDGWVDVGACDAFEDSRARIVCAGGERIAVFRHGDEVSAISNVCRHQGGPLGEGRVIDGCVTCPWHGYQYLPRTGASPPPFTEKVPTYDVRVRAGRVEVRPEPHPPGTPVEPARLPGGAA